MHGYVADPADPSTRVIGGLSKEELKDRALALRDNAVADAAAAADLSLIQAFLDITGAAQITEYGARCLVESVPDRQLCAARSLPQPPARPARRSGKLAGDACAAAALPRREARPRGAVRPRAGACSTARAASTPRSGARVPSICWPTRCRRQRRLASFGR